MLQGGVYKSKGQFQSVDFDTITRVIQRENEAAENWKCKIRKKYRENGRKCAKTKGLSVAHVVECVFNW